MQLAYFHQSRVSFTWAKLSHVFYDFDYIHKDDYLIDQN